MKRSRLWLMGVAALFCVTNMAAAAEKTADAPDKASRKRATADSSEQADAAATEGTAEAAAEATNSGPVKAAPRKGRTPRNVKAPQRLPAHYAQVLDDAQRDEVARSYAKFNTRLAKLRAEIQTLTAERDAAMAAFLTEAQQKRLAELKEAAAARRSAGK